MADKNLMTPSTTSLSGLLGNGVTYNVPVFQRDYSWKNDEGNGRGNGFGCLWFKSHCFDGTLSKI